MLSLQISYFKLEVILWEVTKLPESQLLVFLSFWYKTAFDAWIELAQWHASPLPLAVTPVTVRYLKPFSLHLTLVHWQTFPQIAYQHKKAWIEGKLYQKVVPAWQIRHVQCHLTQVKRYHFSLFWTNFTEYLVMLQSLGFFIDQWPLFQSLTTMLVHVLLSSPSPTKKPVNWWTPEKA